jgi:CubicO group peptidase (beta-lactamase class C family)
MAIPTQAGEILAQALVAGMGSGAALAWQHDGDRDLLALGHTALPQWPHVPVTTQTQFDLASLTKPMATLTLLVQELARGRIALADRLDAHLPLAQGTPRGAATLGQLVSHTSGAPAWLDFFAATRDTLPNERAAAVQRAVLGTPNPYAPGTQAIYSDLGFMALGWLLEHVMERPLDVLYQERVATPLGMQAGYRRMRAGARAADDVVATEVWPPRCAENLPLQGVVHDDNCAALEGVAGHAGLFGSVADVATWADCWLTAVRETSRPTASPLELPTALCRQLVAMPGVPHTSWRHGWDTPSQPGSSAGALAPPDTFGHLGFTGTSVWLAPSVRAFAILLTNRVHPTREAVGGIRSLRPHLHDVLWRTLR